LKQIEAVDVVTPVSVERFTGSNRGYLPWPAPKEFAGEAQKNGVSKTLQRLRVFHIVGQWAEPCIPLRGFPKWGVLSFDNFARTMAKNLWQRLQDEDASSQKDN
jgi:hypothetical protein